MQSITQIITQFIKTNAAAYAKASKVFKDIEGADYVTTLVEAGITGNDIKVFATIYVAERSDVKPHPSQRGDTLVFKKDTPEYNRVKYLVDVATGVRAIRKANAKAKAVQRVNHRLTPEARKAAQAFIAMFENKDDAIAALRAI